MPEVVELRVKLIVYTRSGTALNSAIGTLLYNIGVTSLIEPIIIHLLVIEGLAHISISSK